MIPSAGSRKKLTILIFTLIAPVIFMGLIYFMPNRHSVIILNRTSEDVVISAVRINNESFNAGDKALKPIESKEPRNNQDNYLDYSFEAARDSILIIDIKNQNNKLIRMSCNLIDKNRLGCVHYASIRDTGNLTCVCDSNADFYD